MELIETHAHLYALSDEEAVETYLSRAKSCGISTFICVGASDGIQSAKTAVELSEEFPEVYATVGVHPHDADEYQNLEEIEYLLEHQKVVAVGETGLDFFREWADFDKQQKLFEASISVAKNCSKPIVIHSRDARDECYATLKRLGAEAVGGVFHCYSEDAEFAKKLRDINFSVSLTGVLTFKKAHQLRETARTVPLEQIMLETDCPYMAPEPFRGKPSEPMHVLKIAEKLAEVKELSLEKVAAATSENARRIFRIPT
jgi:TatD DNase family protein